MKLIAGGVSEGEYSASGFGAFSDCVSLKSFSVPSSVVEIGESAFVDCSSLSELSFDDCSELKTIGAMAFYCCGFLRRIDMRNCSKLTSIGSYALYSMSGEGTYLLQIGATIPPVLVGGPAFRLSEYSVLKVPAGSEPAYKSSAYEWSRFSSITAID